ncbi:MAG: hypothetical protein MZU97_24950 [Bacillus subtilis]|nr:hypothetical protein [Bacillus subtilis]
MSLFYNETNQNTLLNSASMHATISSQIIDLATTTLVLPVQSYEATAIQATVAETDYITKAEIKALINALEVLGVTDITAFDGTFDLSDLATETDQDTLLASASMHATIADTLLDLDDTVLLIPEYAQNGTTLIKKVIAATTYVTRSEIKALINAFLAMGYTDLDNFGAGIDSSKFFDDTDTLLLSVLDPSDIIEQTSHWNRRLAHRSRCRYSRQSDSHQRRRRHRFGEHRVYRRRRNQRFDDRARFAWPHQLQFHRHYAGLAVRRRRQRLVQFRYRCKRRYPT